MTDTTGSERRCPECGGGMDTGQHGGVSFEMCGKCHSVWLDRGELSTILGDTADEFTTPGPDHVPFESMLKCPSCGRLLASRRFDAAGGTRIDQCFGCGGIYLESGELAALQAQAGGVTEEAPPKRRKVKRRVERLSRKEMARRGMGAYDLPVYGTKLPPRHGEPLGLGQTSFTRWIIGLPHETNERDRILFAPMTFMLVMANLFFWALMLFYGFQKAADNFGTIPADITQGRHLYTLLTSMFLHAGIAHLFFNMYFLGMFGDNVERRYGAWWYLGFYIVFGICADIIHCAIDPTITIPAIGASGAISGLMGVYLVLFPGNRVSVPILRDNRYSCLISVLRPVIIIPAWVWIGFWFVSQAMWAVLSLHADISNIAFWAHLGGFVAGMLVGFATRIFTPGPG